ncbi:hypothetical protein [uncultured Tenacibaculum sp.]|uniref:hypothetical protein n=1 Tax=uncultured Tenacibaculum sp. TaxID=174713 RepID=UPI002626B959|nr:hypothetical protein [uncultured Tenacibaculum sp.]
MHTSTHSDFEAYEDCDICEYVEKTDKTYILIDESNVSEEVTLHRFNQHFADKYSYVFIKKHIVNSLFGRPPPVV